MLLKCYKVNFCRDQEVCDDKIEEVLVDTDSKQYLCQTQGRVLILCKPTTTNTIGILSYWIEKNDAEKDLAKRLKIKARRKNKNI